MKGVDQIAIPFGMENRFVIRIQERVKTVCMTIWVSGLNGAIKLAKMVNNTKKACIITLYFQYLKIVNVFFRAIVLSMANT